MVYLKSALAVITAGGAALIVSTNALAVTTSPTPTPTATPAPTVAPAGPLTIALTCDSGPSGSGTFKVTATGASSTASVKCGKSASVTNAAWKAGSSATIHQTAATASGQLHAADVKVTLKAAGETVAIRNFRSATNAATTTTLAQTGGGLPALPIAGAIFGLLAIALGVRRFVLPVSR